MSTENEIDYDALAARLTDPDQPVHSAGQVETNDAAAFTGHAWLLREYGSDEAIAAAMSVSRGRSRVGAPKAGPSPTVRARISDDDYAAFKKLEEATGRGQSELVREAVHRMLVDHKLVS